MGSAILCHFIITTLMKIVSQIYLDSVDAIWSTCAISDSLETINRNFWYHEIIFVFRFEFGFQTVLCSRSQVCENLLI